MHMRLECIGVVHVALLAVPVWLLCAPALSLLEVRVCCPLLSLLLWVVIWFSNGPTDSPISLYVQVSCDQLMQETNFCPVLACALEEKRRKEKIYIVSTSEHRPQFIDLTMWWVKQQAFASSIYVTRRCRDIVVMVAVVVNLRMALWGFYLVHLGDERCTFLVISHVYSKSSWPAAWG